MAERRTAVDPKAAAFALTAEGFMNWCEGKPLKPEDFKCPTWAKELRGCNCNFCKGLRRVGMLA